MNNDVVINEINTKNPYIDTILETTISLHPSSMNNQIYLNLKSNLIGQIKGKCYKDFGYVVEIYKIINYDSGYISVDDPHCSAKYKVKFSARLCRPIRNQEIICKIDRCIKNLISVINGPITLLIPSERIDKNNFFIDSNNNFRYKDKINNKSEVLDSGMYVRVQITSVTFHDTDTNIKALGVLLDMATPAEIKIFEDNQTKTLANVKDLSKENAQE